MTKNIQDEVVDPQFDDFPHIRKFISSLDEAWTKYQRLEKAIRANRTMTKGQKIAAFSNALIDFNRDFLTAKARCLADQGLEFQDPETELRDQLFDRMDSTLRNKTIPLGLRRATYLKIAYEHKSAIEGLKAPMDSAVELAAIMEMAEHVPLHEKAELMHRLSLHFQDRSEDLPTDAIRKSVQRYRHAIRGEEVFHFDRDTLTWAAEKAEDAFLAGLPKGRGRPKSK